MSDILDALRKAELARENLRAPGISTQQRYWAGCSGRRGRWKLGLLAGLAAGVCGAVVLVAHTDGVFSVQPMSDAVALPQVSSAPPTRPVVPRPAAAPPLGHVGHLRTPGPRPMPVAEAEEGAATSGLDDEHPDDKDAVDDDVDGDGADDAEEPQQMEVAMIPALKRHADEVSTSPGATADGWVNGATVAASAKSGRAKTAYTPSAKRDSLAATVRRISMMPDPFATSDKPDVSPSPPTDIALLQSGNSALQDVTQRTDEAKSRGEDTVPLLRTMPYRFQTSVPKMVINAQAYGDSVEDRFVVINMKRYVEGQQTDEGVRIDAIRQEDTVLTFQGQKFRLQR